MNKTKKPNPKEWPHKQFSLLNAAFLLCDINPWKPDKDNPPPARVLEMLAQIDRDLKPVYKTYHNLPVANPTPKNKYYSREDLERYALENGLPFLGNQEEKLHGSERTALYKMIRIAAHKADIDISDPKAAATLFSIEADLLGLKIDIGTLEKHFQGILKKSS